MFEQCVSMGDKYVGTVMDNNTTYSYHPYHQKDYTLSSPTCCCGRPLLGIAYSEQSTSSRIVVIFQIQVLQQRIRIGVFGGKGLKGRQIEKKT